MLNAPENWKTVSDSFPGRKMTLWTRLERKTVELAFYGLTAPSPVGNCYSWQFRYHQQGDLRLKTWKYRFYWKYGTVFIGNTVFRLEIPLHDGKYC